MTSPFIHTSPSADISDKDSFLSDHDTNSKSHSNKQSGLTIIWTMCTCHTWQPWIRTDSGTFRNWCWIQHEPFFSKESNSTPYTIVSFFWKRAYAFFSLWQKKQWTFIMTFGISTMNAEKFPPSPQKWLNIDLTSYNISLNMLLCSPLRRDVQQAKTSSGTGFLALNFMCVYQWANIRLGWFNQTSRLLYVMQNHINM